MATFDPINIEGMGDRTGGRFAELTGFDLGSRGVWRNIGKGVGTAAAGYYAFPWLASSLAGLGAEGAAGTGAGESFGLTGAEGAGLNPYYANMTPWAEPSAVGAGEVVLSGSGEAAGLNPYYSSGGGTGGGNWFSNMFRGGGGAGGFNPYSSIGGAGIGGLMGILNAMQQKKDAKKGEEDDRAAVQQGTDALARSLSIEGNPAGSGRALQQLQNYATVANSANARRRREANSAANNNLYGASGFGLAAILAALANSGAFSGGAAA